MDGSPFLDQRTRSHRLRQPTLTQSSGRAEGKSRQDFGKVWARLVQSVGKTLGKCGQDLCKAWARLVQSVGKTLAKRGKKRVKRITTTTTARAKMALKPESWELCGERGRIHLRRRGAGRVLLLRGARARLKTLTLFSKQDRRQKNTQCMRSGRRLILSPARTDEKPGTRTIAGWRDASRITCTSVSEPSGSTKSTVAATAPCTPP